MWPFNQKAKPPVSTLHLAERITVRTLDEQGSPYGILSLSKSSILECQYDAIKNEFIITLVSSNLRGQTVVEPVPNIKVENKKKVTIPGAYTIRELLQLQGYNNYVTVNEESEMRKIWEWLGHDKTDRTFDDLLTIRKDILQSIEKAKEELLKKQEEEKAKEKEKESAGESKIVDKQGNPLKSVDA